MFNATKILSIYREAVLLNNKQDKTLEQLNEEITKCFINMLRSNKIKYNVFVTKQSIIGKTGLLITPIDNLEAYKRNSSHVSFISYYEDGVETFNAIYSSKRDLSIHVFRKNSISEERLYVSANGEIKPLTCKSTNTNNIAIDENANQGTLYLINETERKFKLTNHISSSDAMVSFILGKVNSYYTSDMELKRHKTLLHMCKILDAKTLEVNGVYKYYMDGQIDKGDKLYA